MMRLGEKGETFLQAKISGYTVSIVYILLFKNSDLCLIIKIDGLVWSANYEKSQPPSENNFQTTKVATQLLRVVLCSFHVDATLAHQNDIQNSTYIVPASWQVVKDYIRTCINAIIIMREASINCSYLCLEISYPTQSLRI